MAGAINHHNAWYPDPSGLDGADAFLLAEEIAKDWFQNLHEKPRRDGFRSISRSWAFEKISGTSPFEGNRLIAANKGASRQDYSPGSHPDQKMALQYNINIYHHTIEIGEPDRTNH
jgi:hypothetical protein